MNRMKFVHVLAVAAALVMLSGCGRDYINGVNTEYDNPEPFDAGTTAAARSEAARLSIGDAVDILQRRARRSAHSPTQQTVLEFTPKQFVTYAYYSDGSHSRGLIEPYEKFAPVLQRYVKRYLKTGGESHGLWLLASSDTNWLLPVHDKAEAVPLLPAFWRLKNSTLAEREAWVRGRAARFAGIAARYRAANPKPRVPESAYRSSVLAAAAIRNKRFFDAANAYEDAVKIAPWWPQGQFNAALALGEVRYYDEAIDHMQKYLALVPNAPDARAAQNKIYTWQAAKAAF